MTKLMRNPHATHIDYGQFVGAIESNPKFCPSNIDGIVERKGSVLVMEWKRDNERVSEGQKLLLKALARLPRFTVFIIRGDTDKELKVGKFWQVEKSGKCVLAGDGVDDFWHHYRSWYCVADLQGAAYD